MVSIPYRYATNIKMRLFCDDFSEVSIPYRYATNAVYDYIEYAEYRVSIPYRYATNVDNPIPHVAYVQFQFLIGTLQTRVAEEKAADRLEVSIPYRYATNVCTY